MFALYSNKSCLQLKFWIEKRKGIIEMANAVTSANKGLKEKGQQAYNWTNKVVITIDQNEAFYLLVSIHNKKKYSIVHTINNKTSNLFIDFNFNSGYCNLTITNIVNSNKLTSSFGFKIAGAELDHFSTWCKYVKDMPFLMDLRSNV